MATGWSGAEVTSGGSTYYDREQASRRSRGAAPKVSGSDYSDHYAEKAAAREAAQRTAEGMREWDQAWRERYERDARLLPFLTEDPEPYPLGLPSPDDPDADILEASAEQSAWMERRDQFLKRAEGEELAARIFRR